MGYYDSYLSHHGILGQKWGVRRFQRKDGTRTPAGKERAKENSNNVDENNEEVVKQRKQMDPNTKKAIIIGASVAGGILAAYGGYRVYSIYKHSGDSDKTGFIRKKNDMTADDDMKAVNAHRMGGILDLGGHFSNNCQKCSVTYEMRRRGYDVKAGETVNGEKNTDILKIFKGLDPDDPTHYLTIDNKVDNSHSIFSQFSNLFSNPKSDAESFVKTAQKLGKNSRGVSTLTSPLGAHSVAWENDKHGNIILRDCQIGKKFVGAKEIESYFRSTGMKGYDITKVNDLPIDVNFLKQKSQLGNQPYIRNSKDLEFGLSELQGALAATGTATVAGLATAKVYKDVNGGDINDTRTGESDSTKETTNRN